MGRSIVDVLTCRFMVVDLLEMIGLLELSMVYCCRYFALVQHDYHAQLESLGAGIENRTEGKPICAEERNRCQSCMI